MELGELAAREAIRDLVARYAQCADRGRFADVVALFTADGVLRIDDREPLCGRDDILSFLDGTRRNLASASGVGALRHHVTTLLIDVASADSATGTAYFLVVSGRGPDHWGRYRDRYVSNADRWLFAERSVRVEGFAPDSWAARRRSVSS